MRSDGARHSGGKGLRDVPRQRQKSRPRVRRIPARLRGARRARRSRQGGGAGWLSSRCRPPSTGGAHFPLPGSASEQAMLGYFTRTAATATTRARQLVNHPMFRMEVARTATLAQTADLLVDGQRRRHSVRRRDDRRQARRSKSLDHRHADVVDAIRRRRCRGSAPRRRIRRASRWSARGSRTSEREDQKLVENRTCLPSGRRRRDERAELRRRRLHAAEHVGIEDGLAALLLPLLGDPERDMAVAELRLVDPEECLLEIERGERDRSRSRASPGRATRSDSSGLCAAPCRSRRRVRRGT